MVFLVTDACNTVCLVSPHIVSSLQSFIEWHQWLTSFCCNTICGGGGGSSPRRHSSDQLLRRQATSVLSNNSQCQITRICIFARLQVFIYYLFLWLQINISIKVGVRLNNSHMTCKSGTASYLAMHDTNPQQSVALSGLLLYTSMHDLLECDTMPRHHSIYSILYIFTP